MGSLRKAAFSVATENQQRASANLQLWPILAFVTRVQRSSADMSGFTKPHAKFQK